MMEMQTFLPVPCRTRGEVLCPRVTGFGSSSAWIVPGRGNWRAERAAHPADHICSLSPVQLFGKIAAKMGHKKGMDTGMRADRKTHMGTFHRHLTRRSEGITARYS